MKTTLLAFVFLATTSLFAQSGSPFDGYFAELVDVLHLPALPTGTNTPPWQIPSEVVYDNTSYSVTPVSAEAFRLDRTFRILMGAEPQEIVLHVYPTLTSNNAARIVGCALGGASNLPAEFTAKNFAISTNAFGTIYITPLADSGEESFVVVLHNDAAFRLDASYQDREAYALAVLQAGGVEIPDEPQPEP